jgi:hypothetical protein
MKIDYSTNPPTAWTIEDGELVSVDQRDVMECKVCHQWFVNTNMFDRKPFCSTGCKLKMTDKK